MECEIKTEWCTGKDVKLVQLRDQCAGPKGTNTFNGAISGMCAECRKARNGSFKILKRREGLTTGRAIKKATEDMRQEVYTCLVNLLGGQKAFLISYTRRSVCESVPYGGHLSNDWRGIGAHADVALDRMKKLILDQIGNIQIEIRQREVDRDRIKKNLADALPLDMWAEMKGKIEKIEQGKK